VAHGEDGLADLEVGGLAEVDGVEIAGVYLEDGEVCGAVTADDFGGLFAAVAEGDGDAASDGAPPVMTWLLVTMPRCR
jgi:hypothetical protein